MLRKHFIMSGLEKPDYIITYYADLKVPFIGGEETKNLTMWETGSESEPLAEFKVVSDTYSNGYGLWGIRTSNPTAYYSLILDLYNNTYYADSSNPDSITGIIFPEGITHIHGSILNNISTQTSLKDVTIPVSTTSLTGNLFGNYNGLTSITVPYNVTRIDNLCSVSTNDTYTNTALEEIILQPLTPPDASLSNNQPLGIYNSEYTKDNFKIRVYADAINNYRTHTIWGLYSDLYDTINNAICYTSTNGEQISTSINGIHTKLNNRWVLTTDTDTIPAKAFTDLSHLQSIAIPTNITKIDKQAFGSMSDLTSIVVAESNTVYDSREDCNAIIETASNTIIQGSQNTIIPDSVTKIGAGAFRGVTKDTIIIPEQITDVGGTSLNLKGLSSVGWNVKRCNDFQYTTSDNYAFGYTFNKLKLTLGDSVERIPNYFGKGLRTESFIIPDNVRYIGVNAVPSTSSIVIGQGVRRFYPPIQKENILTTSVVWNAKNIHQQIGDMFSETAKSAFKSFEFGVNIKTIPNNLCESCIKLSSVVIPNSVTSIGMYAFDECYSLPLIDIPDSVTSIGSYAFLNCESLTEIVIPNSVTSIGSGAFAGCSKLKLVEIPNSVTRIESSTFSGCTLLESITIPNSVKSFETYAFEGCSNLTSITIPDSVTSIGYGVFKNCSSLTSITIPNSVTSIGERAFEGCTSLQKTNIKDITKWCNISFPTYISNPIQHSRNLYINDVEISELVIPATVDTVNAHVFNCCDTLTSVLISEGVKNIKTEAFWQCANLASIVIPTSVTSIGVDAFTNSKFYNDSSNWNNNVLYINDCLIKAKTNINIGTYRILDNTRLIADRAFYQYYYLTSIIIPDSVTHIGAEAFEYCSQLTNITIPNSVTSIGDKAFKGCSSLTSFTLPDSVTNIGKYVFSDCKLLTSPVYNAHLFAYMPPSDVVEYTIPEGIEQIMPYAFEYRRSITDINIPNSVKSIGTHAFSYCEGLTSITIPNSVESIGSYAFALCYSLTSATIPNSIISIANNAFDDCSSLTSIDIPDSVTSIGSSAFSGCESLTSIDIPDSVTKIEYLAFRDCYSLTSITIPNSVTSIGSSAFYGCKSLTNVNIPSNIETIEGDTFRLCTALASITIPNSVTKIGEFAFYGCSSLASITIPDSVTSIGLYAFGNCTSLTSVTIPNSVTSIGLYAFKNCELLTSIIYNGTMEEWDAILIIFFSNDNIPETCIVHCVDGDIPILEA